ncbi:Flp pilus assembly protein TadG [Rhodopseudomonas julia]|uniref:Flp pilus assembly protein TadG n=1 Tax=Rhodopseudomonas julia TaxID=200617 RepID=A0ABU0C6R9_9BRAD|nr:pilus assembly protein TadG-related protein [Rhodopseudomonas julia]MDQ0325644.1 Flp pilus assembly protein TadG [Rhodopseudomonas julia]
MFVMLCSLRRLFHRYLRREDGSVAPLIGFSALGLIALMGFAVDVGRAQFVQAKLLNAADAGGLAAGSRINSTNVQEEVEQFVRANFPDGYANAHITNVEAKVNAAQTTITVNASAKVPTTFMRLLGFRTLTVSAYSEVTREMGGLEVVMVLDNTGSMRSSLGSLKTAAKTLVDILFGDDAVAENLYVGLVPFSQGVNIGGANKGWIIENVTDPSDPHYADYGQSAGGAWGGCVEARTGGQDVTDTPPMHDDTVKPPIESRFHVYLWPDSDSNNWNNSTRYCTGFEIWGDCYYGEWKVTKPTAYYTPYNNSWRSPNKYCSEAVTPMTPVKSTIEAGINRMTTDGNTHINLGAVWGWRMLSPRWRGYWGGDMGTNGLPLDYNNELMDKAAIIMTDGENTWGEEYSAYGPESDQRLGYSNPKGELNKRLEQVCTSMKNAGILVYTIAFNKPGYSTEQMMRRCASQDSFYFDSPDTSALQTAFKQIGDSLSNLRVSR